MDRNESSSTAVEHARPPQTGHGNGASQGHSSEHSDEVDLNVPRPRPVWVVLAAVVAVGALAALLATGFIPRQRNERELAADAESAGNAAVLVNVTRPKRAESSVSVSLPRTLRPWQEVSIFARTTGYLKSYKVDISNEVQVGQVMAEIDTPEVNEELAQAKAAVLQTKAAVNKAIADRDLAKTTLARMEALKETQSVTPQQIDERKSALDVAESMIESARANVEASQASVRRLTELTKFETIRAPFSGVVTGRGYDVGSLILANPTATDVKPMFKIAENDILRAFVNVPQSAALQIKKQQEVQITVRERPGRVFKGSVMGTTNYLDPSNRSLLTEVKVQNPKEADGTFALLPGMYVQASFTVKRDTPPLIIPGPAIITNAQGTQVAVMENGTAHFTKVKIGQDYGSQVEIVEGLTGDEQVIENPGERIAEGVAVRSGSDTTSAQAEGSSPAAAPKVKLTEATK